MLETIQGEGGILPCDKKFLKDLRKLCNEKNILLILDEIQCGNGRTGKYFAYQHYNIVPDILTIAKGLAGGLPIGACIVKEDIGKYMKKGSHGSTFGGNALCCCVGNACIDELSKDKFLQNVSEVVEYFKNELQKLCNENKQVFKKVEGKGLMLGVFLNEKYNSNEIVKLLLENGLSCCSAGNNSIRFLPHLIVKKKHIDKAIKILRKTYKEFI